MPSFHWISGHRGHVLTRVGARAFALNRAAQRGHDQEERGVFRVEPRVFVAAALPRPGKI